MKTLTKIVAGFLFVGLLATGCESLLDVKSDRFVLPEDNQLNSPNDTIYSMVGIFSKVQKLADRYILLGELRGDLMSTSPTANLALREIYNFEVSEENPYNKPEDYYAVINHCNYLITYMDTSIVSNGEKGMLKEYAAAKAFRAWTYIQLAINYGKAKYYTNPILTVKDAEKDYPEYTLAEMANFLIQDLEPYKLVEFPGSIALGRVISSGSTYFPIRALLGELYLWTGQYEMAAREYHALIVEEEYVIGEEYQSLWEVQNGVFVQRDMNDQAFLNIFNLTFNSSEAITYIAGSTEYGDGAELDSLTVYYNKIVPSPVAIAYWDQQTYYHNASVFTQGDLRGDMGAYLGDYFWSTLSGSAPLQDVNLIYKYVNQSLLNDKGIMALRVATIYLRYAEAVNRAGKPNLAFAVLKNGLNNRTMLLDTIVPPREKYVDPTDSVRVLWDYMEFSNFVFNDPQNLNLGVHSRGCGNIHQSTDFVIPELPTLEDSMRFVEDKIVMELALETGLEGNRFQDLMRVAKRRNDPAYLANRVALKYADIEGMRAKLLDENNWYLP